MPQYRITRPASDNTGVTCRHRPPTEVSFRFGGRWFAGPEASGIPDLSTISALLSVTACDNIALFSPFPPYSDSLRSLRSLRHPPSASAPAPASFPIPSFLPPLFMTRVPYYGLFLMFPDLYLVFPLDCVILRSLLDSLR